MPGGTYGRQLGSLLLCLCDVFRALINSLVCCLPSVKCCFTSTETVGLLAPELCFSSVGPLEFVRSKDLVNTELSPERYKRGQRSPKVTGRGRREIIPDATLSSPE